MNKNIGKFLLTVLFLLIGALGINIHSISAQAQGGRLSMRVRPAYDGYFKYGEWTVVWIDVENNGPDIRSSAQVRISGSGGIIVYSTLIELPTNSRKHVPLYVLPNNYSRELEIQLISNDRKLVTEIVPIKPQLNNSYFIGLIANNRGALSLINGIRIPRNNERPLFLIDVPLDDFPERFEALTSFDCLILNDIDTSILNPQQQNALNLWVMQGGRLILGGGTGAEKTLSGLPDSLIPVGFSHLIEIPKLSVLESMASPETIVRQPPTTPEFPIRAPGPFLLAVGNPVERSAVINQDSYPLMVEIKSGGGSVSFLALDLSGAPFNAWPGTTPFWESLLSPGAAFPSGVPPDVSARQQIAGQMPYTLSNLPILELPSARGLALLLSMYIILIGPANYIYLRKRNRLHWAWVTIPVITLIFSIGAFGLGYFLHGTDFFINKITIIEVFPEGEALSNSYIGIFSPAQRNYEIKISGNGIVSAMSPFYSPWDSSSPLQNVDSAREITLVQSNPSMIQGSSIEQWSMHSFMVEGLWSNLGQVPYEILLEGQTLKGFIQNKTDQTISDAVILVDKRIYRMGDLAPGQKAEVNFQLTDSTSTNFGPPTSYLLFEEELNRGSQSGSSFQQVEAKRQIVETIFERTPPYHLITARVDRQNIGYRQLPIFLGWVDTAPPTIEVMNTQPGQQSTALLVIPITFTVPKGEIIVPAGIIPGELIEAPTEGGACGEPGSTSIYLYRGSGVFEFSLPAQLQTVAPKLLRLSIWDDAGWVFPPEVSIFDWEANNWISLSGINQGINLIPNASYLVSPMHTIRVRLSAQDNGQACVNIALGLEGTH